MTIGLTDLTFALFFFKSCTFQFSIVKLKNYKVSKTPFIVLPFE